MRERPVHKRRRGNATIVVISFGVLLGFTALALDVGLIRLVDTELQAALDSASLSAVSELDGTDDGITRAHATAINIAAQNLVLGAPVSLVASDVVIGAYDRATDTFDPYDAGDDTQLVNAVRVNHTLPPVAAIMSQIPFGVSSHTRAGRSMSLRDFAGKPASSTSCFLPLAIPDCHLAGVPLGSNPPPMTFTFSPSPTDAIAWADPAGNPSSAAIQSRIVDPCSATIETGDPIYVNEGVHNVALQTIKDIINGVGPVGRSSWDVASYGGIMAQDIDSTVNPADYTHTFEGPVAIVDGGTDCSAVSFTGTLPITGIGWAVIYDVSDQGGNKFLKIQLDLVKPHDIWGETDDDATGPNVTAPSPPALARW